jgi:DNA-binding SARP family transcriptional activator/tetratricopeptide (TPR) repeat protein
VEFGVLGPVVARQNGQLIPLGGPPRRCVLGVLLLEAGRVVPAERLVEFVWGQHPPAVTRNAVATHVSRLRKLLVPDPTVTISAHGTGYVLNVDRERVDVHRFRRLVAQARADDNPRRARDLLHEALRLWRGAPLAGVVPAEVRHRLCGGLEEERLVALEERLAADLGLGRPAEVAAELVHLVQEHPLRERLVELWMAALCRCDRQADALAAYRQARARMVDELGIEPGHVLREMHRRILNGEQVAEAPSRPGRGTGEGRADRPVPAQLPPAVPAFTGRVEYMRRLDAALDDSRGHPATVVISLITGTAGVGKTELAVRWAHRVRPRFPDGQLYVNLRGYAARAPMRPIEALSQFLRALGVPAEQVPTGEEEATALYRTILTDRRVLVVLDNASTVDQVRPLLPGSPGCVVVVTGRDRHAGLVAREGAHRLDVEVFTPNESRALLARILGSARVAAESDAAAELATLCAHLPLALRIAVAHLNSRPHRGIATHVAELRAGNRLAALSVPGDEESAMRATLDLSYAVLPADARRMFGLLGLVPGMDVTVRAAAALAGTTETTAADLLDRLTAAHLLSEHTSGRFAFHDLLRVYAAEQAALVDGADEALNRLRHWYLDTAHWAARALYPHMLRLAFPLPETTDAVAARAGTAGHSDAAAWLDAERRNLLAVIRQAAEHGPPTVAFQLADVLRGYFFLRRYIVDWLAVGRVQETLANTLGDLRAQAAAQLTLGEAHLRDGRYTDAIAHFQAASAVNGRSAWPAGQAAALGGVATVYLRSGRTRQAADEYARTVALLRDIDNAAALANNLGNLSLVLRQLGELRQAAVHYAEAIVIFRRIGSRYAEAVSLGNLGMIYHDLGELELACDHLTQALALHREIGDRGSEADTLSGLAAVHLDLGSSPTALDLAREAVTLARHGDNRYTEAYAVHTLADVSADGGDYRDALDLHRQAHRLATDTGNRHLRVAASIGIATDYRLLGHPDRAAAHADEALVLAQQAGYLVLEGRSLTARAEIELARQRSDLAEDFARRALASHLHTGHRPGEARARHVLDAVRRQPSQH